LALSSQLKRLINGVLAPANLQLGTLTASKVEYERLRRLADRGHFERPAFPLLKSFSSLEGKVVTDAYAAYRQDIARLLAQGEGPHRYDPDNEYFCPADACPTYLIARSFKPATWFEVGSGNSTRVVRQAIEDGGLATRLICVDPYPRAEVSSVADEMVRAEVQTLVPQSIADRLDGNDVLFIDSSHQLKAGGDVPHLLLNVLPRLRPGVLVHIHDVFLPYDYPRDWVEERAWNEQYLVQAMLQFSAKFEVLWAGYYTQQSRPDVAAKLDFLTRGRPASLWLRVLD
jgi:hypothetical protein